MKKFVMSFTALATLVAPAVALAQTQGVPNTSYIDYWIGKLLGFAQQGTTFLMIAATLYFIWSVISYIREKDAKEAANKKNAMLRGIIGLFVIVAIWGIIRLLANVVGVSTSGQSTITIPCPPGMTYSNATKSCI